MKKLHIYSVLLSFSLVFAANKTTTTTDLVDSRIHIQKFEDIRHMSTSVIMRLIALAEEEVRLENEMRMEQEKREKIYRQYLASRVQSSIMRDFLTSRY